MGATEFSTISTGSTPEKALSAAQEKAMEATPEQWAEAQEILDDHGYRGRPIETHEEVFEVLDSFANGDDVIDGIEEHRMWRTPMGMRQEDFTR